LVKEIIDKAGLQPKTIYDIGCGAGEVLVQLKSFYYNLLLAFNKDWAVRLFGGETIIVLAKARNK
jgi:type I restriction-modification system DNA methylase subunit